jgi:hypothetical protein
VKNHVICSAVERSHNTIFATLKVENGLKKVSTLLLSEKISEQKGILTKLSMS